MLSTTSGFLKDFGVDFVIVLVFSSRMSMHCWLSGAGHISTKEIVHIGWFPQLVWWEVGSWQWIHYWNSFMAVEIFKPCCFMHRLLLREWMCMPNPGMIGHVSLFFSLVSWVAFGVLTLLWLCISMCLLKRLCVSCASTNGEHLNWYFLVSLSTNYLFSK